MAVSRVLLNSAPSAVDLDAEVSQVVDAHPSTPTELEEAHGSRHSPHGPRSVVHLDAAVSQFVDHNASLVLRDEVAHDGRQDEHLPCTGVELHLAMSQFADSGARTDFGVGASHDDRHRRHPSLRFVELDAISSAFPDPGVSTSLEAGSFHEGHRCHQPTWVVDLSEIDEQHGEAHYGTQLQVTEPVDTGQVRQVIASYADGHSHHQTDEISTAFACQSGATSPTMADVNMGTLHPQSSKLAVAFGDSCSTEFQPVDSECTGNSCQPLERFDDGQPGSRTQEAAEDLCADSEANAIADHWESCGSDALIRESCSDDLQVVGSQDSGFPRHAVGPPADGYINHQAHEADRVACELEAGIMVTTAVKLDKQDSSSRDPELSAPFANTVDLDDNSCSMLPPPSATKAIVIDLDATPAQLDVPPPSATKAVVIDLDASPAQLDIHWNTPPAPVGTEGDSDGFTALEALARCGFAASEPLPGVGGSSFDSVVSRVVSSDGLDSEATSRPRASLKEDMRILAMSSPGLIRATRASVLLGCIGSVLRRNTAQPRSAEDRRATRRCCCSSGHVSNNPDASFAVSKIDQYWSQSWHGYAPFKVLSIMFYYNATGAALLANAVFWIVALLGLLVCMPWTFAPHLHTCFGVLIFLVRLLARRPSATVFVDRVCIDQRDVQRQLECATSVGAFLAVSERLLVVWDETYPRRLWCVFELAAYFKLHGGQNIDFLPATLGPVLLTYTCLCAAGPLLVSHTALPALDGSGCMAALAAYFIGGSCIVSLARYHHRSLAAVSEQLAAFRLSDTESYCCTVDHVDPSVGTNLPCDREIIADCIFEWFGSLLEFDNFVRSQLTSIQWQQLGPIGIRYKHVQLCVFPLVWLFVGDFFAHASAHHEDRLLWMSERLNLFLFLVLFANPIGFAILFGLARRFKALRSRWVANVFVSAIVLLLSGACFISALLPTYPLILVPVRVLEFGVDNQENFAVCCVVAAVLDVVIFSALMVLVHVVYVQGWGCFCRVRCSRLGRSRRHATERDMEPPASA